MIGWIARLCVLCAVSALVQLMLSDSAGRDSLRVLCGLSMLHMTLECVQRIAQELMVCTSLDQVFACLMR